MAKMRLNPGATELEEALAGLTRVSPGDEYIDARHTMFKGLVTLYYGNGSNTTMGW